MAVSSLKKEYPIAVCSLNYDSPIKLLIATRLAAQCTDKRVNTVTPDLFKRYPTLNDLLHADEEEMQTYIKSCGFYKTKAHDIIAMCKQIAERFGGEVPNNMQDLLSLPGVGRKTANLILGDIFNKPAVVVDTHCIRITKRLGFHNIKNPQKIENILRAAIAPKESNEFCHRLVLHGRKICKARTPLCDMCCMNEFCKYRKTNDFT